MAVNSPSRGLMVFTAFIYKLLIERKVVGKGRWLSAYTTVAESQFLLFPCLSLHTKLLEIHRIYLQHLSPYSGLFSSSTSPLPTLQHTLKLSLIQGFISARTQAGRQNSESQVSTYWTNSVPETEAACHKVFELK